jgi:hypothetical protein
LTGSHYYQNLQNYGIARPLPPFDYTTYLDFMQLHNHNFMRMWVWETTWQAPWLQGDFYYDPLPFARSSLCCAADGGNKFDLNTFNQAYFDRLRGRIIAAGQRGIYVSIMLFDGWSTWSRNAGMGNPYIGHPFRAGNNINGTDGDPLGIGEGYMMHTLDPRVDPSVRRYQNAYIQKVIDTVNDLDNVLYEIANESDADRVLVNAAVTSVNWQYDLIQFIKTYEAGKPKQHPVGMTAGPGLGVDNNAFLWSSPADWISPGGVDPNSVSYQSDPPVPDGSKVVLIDTDHVFGFGGDQVWIWKTFMRGLNPIYMDPYIEGGGDESSRVAMGETLSYARRINLAGTTPRGGLTSTQYALANPPSEYLVFQPNSGPFTVDLRGAAQSYAIEWLDIKTNSYSAGGSVAGGAVSSFTPPFQGPAVLYLKSL